MKKVLFAFFCTLLMMGCNTSSNAQNKNFVMDMDSIGIIVGNTVKFYLNDNDYVWNESPRREFTLPNGYKSIFVMDMDSIGVIVGNTVKFYFNDNDYVWNESPRREFTLN